MLYPVVGEVLVDDLAHLGVFVVEHFRRKEENDVEHRGLRGERRAAVFGERVRCDLVVDVV